MICRRRMITDYSVHTRTRVPDRAADGVALLEEELHEPGRDETAGAGDANGAAAAGGAAVGRVDMMNTHVSICKELAGSVSWGLQQWTMEMWLCMRIELETSKLISFSVY